MAAIVVVVAVSAGAGSVLAAAACWRRRSRGSLAARMVGAGGVSGSASTATDADSTLFTSASLATITGCTFSAAVACCAMSCSRCCSAIRNASTTRPSSSNAWPCSLSTARTKAPMLPCSAGTLIVMAGTWATSCVSTLTAATTGSSSPSARRRRRSRGSLRARTTGSASLSSLCGCSVVVTLLESVTSSLLTGSATG